MTSHEAPSWWVDDLPVNNAAAVSRAMTAREHIADPTAKIGLPKNLLAAIGNAHFNLKEQIGRVVALLDAVGWPEGENPTGYDLEGPFLSNALDYARETARLTWVLCGLVNSLEQSLGEITVGDDGIGHPILTGPGPDPTEPYVGDGNKIVVRTGETTVEEWDPALVAINDDGTVTPPWSRGKFYPVERERPAPPPGAPKPVYASSEELAAADLVIEDGEIVKRRGGEVDVPIVAGLPLVPVASTEDGEIDYKAKKPPWQIFHELPTVNKTVHKYKIAYEGFEIPQLEVHSWPAYSKDDKRQVYKDENGWQVAGEKDVYLTDDWDGPFTVWTINFRRNLAWDFDSWQEALNISHLVAVAMSVGAGYAFHGSLNRLNKDEGPAFTK